MSRDQRRGQDLASAGKRLRAEGFRLPDIREERPYFCRNCGARALAEYIPRGWYSLTRHPGKAAERTLRLGLFCSAACVAEMMPRIVGIEEALGERWQDIAATAAALNGGAA